MKVIAGLVAVFAILFISTILHEFGHYFMCRKYGIQVNRFRIGFGPSVTVGTYRGTKFQVGPLLIGGACMIDDEAFNKADVKHRIAVLAGGVTMNFLFGAVCLAIAAVMQSAGFGDAVRYGLNSFVSIVGNLGKGLIQAFDPRISGWGGTAELIGNRLSEFNDPVLFVSFLFQLSFILNLALGIMNILPVPGLDGGQIVMALPELIGVKLNRTLVDRVNFACLTGLMGISMYVMIKDFALMALSAL